MKKEIIITSTISLTLLDFIYELQNEWQESIDLDTAQIAKYYDKDADTLCFIFENKDLKIIAVNFKD